MFYREEYERHLVTIGRSAGTRRVHRYTLRIFVEFLASRGIDTVKAVGESHVEAFARHLVSRGYGSRYRGGLLITLRCYFQFLEDRKIIFLSPASTLRLPVRNGGHHPAYGHADLMRWFESLDCSTAMGLRARAILELAYSAALRPREVQALKLTDIDDSKGVIFIEQSKNKKDRIVPVGKTALDWVNRYVTEVRSRMVRDPDHGFVFVSHVTGNPLGSRGLVWALADACGKASIPRLSIYSMRASAATNMLGGGMGIVHISRLLGHACIKTTQVYLRTRERKLSSIIGKHHPRFHADRNTEATA